MEHHPHSLLQTPHRVVLCSLLDWPAGPTAKIPSSLTVTASKTKGQKTTCPKSQRTRGAVSADSAQREAAAHPWAQALPIPKLSGIFHVGKTWAEQDQELNPAKEGTKYINIYPTR